MVMTGLCFVPIMIQSVDLNSECRNVAFGADLELPSGIVRLFLHILSFEFLLLREGEEKEQEEK
jgi:hypothetical protein